MTRRLVQMLFFGSLLLLTDKPGIARTKARHQTGNKRATGCLPGHGSQASRYTIRQSRMKSTQPISFLRKRNNSNIGCD